MQHAQLMTFFNAETHRAANCATFTIDLCLPRSSAGLTKARSTSGATRTDPRGFAGKARSIVRLALTFMSDALG